MPEIPLDPEDEEWRVTQEYMRAIAERLILAGWGTRAVDTDMGAGFGLTAKGVERMDNLFEALRDLDPHTMREEHIRGLILYLTLRDERKNPPGSAE